MYATPLLVGVLLLAAAAARDVAAAGKTTYRLRALAASYEAQLGRTVPLAEARRLRDEARRRKRQDGGFVCRPTTCNAALGADCTVITSTTPRDFTVGDAVNNKTALCAFGHFCDGSTKKCAVTPADPIDISCQHLGQCALHDMHFGALRCDDRMPGGDNKCHAWTRPGDKCDNDACARANLECRDGECRGVAPGGSCPTIVMAAKPCEPQHTCVANVCRRTAKAGEACVDADNNCDEGSECVGGTCLRHYTVAAGGACSEPIDCADGLYCGADGTCKAAVAAKTCTGADDESSCTAGCSCQEDGTFRCQESIGTPAGCKAKAAAWADCVLANDCMGGDLACPPCYDEEIALLGDCDEVVQPHYAAEDGTAHLLCFSEWAGMRGSTKPIDNNAGKAKPVWSPTPSPVAGGGAPGGSNTPSGGSTAASGAAPLATAAAALAALVGAALALAF